jgi:hypothetical protein
LSGVSYNIFAMIRRIGSNAPSTEYKFKIADAKFSDKDEPTSQILRLEMEDKLKFFCHRNRAQYRDPELIGAIFTAQITKLECLK